MKKRDMSGLSGFTLIEVIAVLLILAVLAAVAVPRYMNMVEEARMRSLDGALAAGYSQLSLSYAQLALQTGVPPLASAVAASATANKPAGDFGYTFTAASSNITVAVTKGTSTTNGVWTIP